MATPVLKIYRGDGVYKSEIEKKRARAGRCIEGQKQWIRHAIESLDGTAGLLADYVAKDSHMGFLIPNILEERDAELQWIFNALGGINEHVYQHYVLTGEVF